MINSRAILVCLADDQRCDNYWFGINKSGTKMEGDVSRFRITIGTLFLGETWSDDHKEVWND